MLPTYKGYVQDLVIKLNGIQKLAFDNLVASKYKSKKYYDKSNNPKNFTLGDYGFLLSGPKPGKFEDHYTGPHKIIEVLNKNNVKIQIKTGTKIVHTNRLRISNINKEIKTSKNKTNNKKNDDETNEINLLILFLITGYSIMNPTISLLLLFPAIVWGLIGYDCGPRSLKVVLHLKIFKNSNFFY